MEDYKYINDIPWGVYSDDIEYANIEDGVTSIGDRVFLDCTSLTSITIPDGVTSIGDHAFGSCTSLTSVTIPDSVTSIGGWAFEKTPWLEAKLEENPLWIRNNVLLEANSNFEGECVIPNGVTSIGGYAFLGCTRLTSVTIPNSVTSIGNFAFEFCESLTSVTIPNGVTSIGDCVFEYCDSLTSVTIPGSVKNIGYDAFRYCSDLTSVIIPDSVTSIGDNAFSECSSLTSIVIENPDCEIIDDSSTISNYYNGYVDGDFTFTGTIYGEKDSIAQDYAKTYGYAFDTLKNAPKPAGSLGDGADGIRKKIEDAIADVRVERDRSVDVDKKRQLRKASKLMDRALEALDDIDVNSGEEDGKCKKASSSRK